jgi:TetR/AcrR family transcriptional regulator, repressor of fatR-cypB operon
MCEVVNEYSFMSADSLTVPQPLEGKATAILDAALIVFDERSYGLATMPMVAAQARVAAGTIYRYFVGKEELANALYRRSKIELAEASLAGVVIDGVPAATAFAEIWRRLCEFAASRPEAFAFLETHHHQPYLDADSQAIAASVDAQIAALVAEWQRRGEVRLLDPAVLVAQVFGGLVGVVRHFRSTGRLDSSELFTLTLDTAWCSLSAERTPS